MAYIPGYTYDIFISYAHLDNLKMYGQQLGWIELFYQSLNLKLAQRIGKMDAVKIWWDSKRLDGSILFDGSIEKGVKDSALFISLISPGYLQSDYCKKEMELFYEKSAVEKNGRSVGDNSRMIKVLLNNIPYTEMPSQFGNATGFPFYKAADKDDFGEPLNYTDPQFADQLKTLRDALVRIFEAFPKEEKLNPATAVVQMPYAAQAITVNAGSEVQKKGFNIFIGDVADSLRTTRKRTIAELEKNGYTIITNIPPPEEPVAHEQKVKEVLQTADLAIHLLDQFPGRDIEGIDEWYPKKQAEISLQFAKAKLLWVPAELDIDSVEEVNYQAFLRGIENKNDSTNKFEYIRGNKSELSRQIMDYSASVMLGKVRKESDEKISVLIDTHFSDEQFAIDLGKILIENNMQSFINPQEDDPRKNINLLSERISQVNKMVFLYGHVSRDWVIERMNAALQLIVTNSYPVEDFYIYMAPPNKPNDDIKIRQRFLKVNVMNFSTQPGLNQGLISNFIKDMKGGSVG